jgi:hypothetical protein
MKNITTIGLLSLLISIPYLVSAQKKAAGVYPFTYLSGQVSENQTNVVYGEIATLIEKSGRFVAVNRANFKQVVKERTLNKEESFIDGKALGEARDIGAEIIFVGNVLGLTQYGDPIVHLSAIDAVTNKVIASEVISRTERRSMNVGGSIQDMNNQLWRVTSDSKSWQTLDKAGTAIQIWDAVKNLTAKLDNQVESFLDAHFPLQLSIARFEDDGKSKIKKAFIKRDQAKGLDKNDKVDFIEEKTVTNRDGTTGTTQDVIAKGKVEGINGDYYVIKITEDEAKLYEQKDNLKVFIIKK